MCVACGEERERQPCGWCGSTLTPKHDRYRWLCVPCGDRNVEEHTATCLECRRRYERSTRHGWGNGVGLCSEQCRRLHQHYNDVARWARRDTPERQPVVCGQCGQTFTPKRSDAQYCSGRCRVAAHRAKP